MMKLSWTATSAAACALALGLEVIALAGCFHTGTSWLGMQAEAVAPAATQPLLAPVAAAPAVQPTSRQDSYYAQIRSRIHWVETRIGTDKLLTPDDSSRMLLAKSAAERAGLQDVGLSFKDVYSWIPRMGASKDGTPNLGLAQFEPATARALGLRNPNDPVEAIHVAAMHMKEAAEWSANRIANLNLGAGERAEKLREGVSIFYNLSTKGRNRWNGRNTAKLPIETQLHIRNARNGALFAAEIEAKQPAAGILLAGG
jgi:hypothetical protein